MIILSKLHLLENPLFWFNLAYVSLKPQDGSKTQTEEETGEDSDNESMGGEEAEETGKSKEKSETSRQNKKLHVAGMLNTKKQKADKKRRKKAKKAAADEDLMDGDYDFKVDYAKKKDSAMDEGDEVGIEAKVPMAVLAELPEE